MDGLLRLIKSKKGIAVILLILMSMVVGLSYSVFVISTSRYKASEMLVSNLVYGINIEPTNMANTTVEGKTVRVLEGSTTTILVKITSLNPVESKYSLEYKINEGVAKVYYSYSTGWLPSGKINKNGSGVYEKTIKVVIEAETQSEVEFNVSGGYTYNDTPDTIIGYTKIDKEYDKVEIINEANLTDIIETNTTNNTYGGESKNNYLEYNGLWRILGKNEIGIKLISNESTSKTEISNIPSSLSSIYNTLTDRDKYVLNTNKFNCSSSGCKESSYNSVGLISTYEYELIGGINSYLAPTESYFSINNTDIMNITNSGIESTEEATTSGIRPSIYLTPEVNVTGSGTISDPYRIISVGKIVTIKYKVNGEIRETEPLKSEPYIVDKVECTNGAEGYWSEESSTVVLTKEKYPTTCTVNFKEGYAVALTGTGVNIEAPTNKTVGRTGTTSFNITANSGYTLTNASLSCPSATITRNNNVITISNIKENQTCTINAKQNYVYVQYHMNGGSWAGSTNTTLGVDGQYITKNGNKNVSAYNYNQTNIDVLNYNYKDYINISKTGYVGVTGAEWRLNNATTGKTINQSQAISAKDLCDASKESCTVVLYVNWEPLYTVTLTVTNGSGGSSRTTTSGGSLTFSGIKANTNYTLSGSTISCNGGATATINTSGVASISNVTKSQTCTATMKELPKVTLTVANGSGTTSKYSSSSGSNVSFTNVKPNSGYTASGATISCNGGSTGTISGTTVTIKSVTKTQTCTVTMQIIPGQFYNKILADNPTHSTKTKFDLGKGDVSTTTQGTIYSAIGEDNKTTVYYYAGGYNQNNWLQFGQDKWGNYLYWRIIRTNADKGIRLLYAGSIVPSSKPSNGSVPKMRNALIHTTANNGTAGATNHTEVHYSDNYTNGPISVGYMYGDGTTIETHRKNTTSSAIKRVIDKWYIEGLNTKTDGIYTYDKYISKGAIYCNDRSYYGTYSPERKSQTTFAIKNRMATGSLTDAYPSYVCGVESNPRGTNAPTGITSGTEDKFSASTSQGGNGKLTYPVATLTMDEAIYAGFRPSTLTSSVSSVSGFWINSNTGGACSGYLNAGNKSFTANCSAYSVWVTMTPWSSAYRASSSFMTYMGTVNYAGASIAYQHDYGGGARPVISLKSCVSVTGGNGSASKPYTVGLDGSCATKDE